MIDRILRVNGLFARTPKSVVNLSSVLAEFEAVRKNGYALDREETVLGGVCIGAPVFDAKKRAVASVSISTPLIRMNQDREAETIRLVLEAASQISASAAEAPVRSSFRK